MGLDMYLYADKYVSGYEHQGKDRQERFAALLSSVDLAATKQSPHAHVKVCVAYWRKANAIHSWFVEHVQDGRDECQESSVTRTQLTELRDLCQRVLVETPTKDGTIKNGATFTKETGWTTNTQPGIVATDTAVAEQLLPTRAGFFFGDTNYDEFYLQDLRETIEQLDKALALPDDVEFYYRASW